MNSNEFSVKGSDSLKLVTVGVPIYRRLEYLPSVLKMIAAQDYPAVELIVSDNGQNGTKVHEVVRTLYSRQPCRVRQNPVTVDISEHFNQIINEASGEYYITLNDDDEISPNYASELVRLMEENPQATVAMGKQEIIDTSGAVLRKSKENLPTLLSGPDFIRAIWQTFAFRFENVESFLTKTKLLRETGGYPEFANGNHSDDAAVIRTCINDYVVLSSKCTYRHRVHEGGFGWLATIKGLAAATRDFIGLLESDPTTKRFDAAHPQEWKDLKEILVRMSWETYLLRWKDIYKDRLSGPQWIAAAFAMPFLPSYYRNVASVFRNALKARMKSLLTGRSEKHKDFFARGAKYNRTDI